MGIGEVLAHADHLRALTGQKSMLFVICSPLNTNPGLKSRDSNPTPPMSLIY
jgi:hypothetical protein